ncbi:MAG: hypothetical protein GYB26_14885 [Gammaproteobacteria bacterium]|uniref:Uncharacterized protein n=1 Tax=Marinobacter litoralis TaxID=187981 RepID=A0A3M2RB13_9GAMM|nr:DUF6776 family protein [Marinobacter litoralis]MBR9872418.1 hypothetical protein [Gammaproteobacteria bacterium]RMJ02506.1 hypothetical protein DOQ08_01968 [Marinobacter litoralis]
MSETPKPSEEYVVIRHRRGYRLRRTLILLGFTIVAAISGYMAGMAQGGFRFTSAEETKDMLVNEVDGLREQYRSARQNMINLERGRAIDEQALRDARNAIVELETRISELEADLTFYRNIMAPTEVSKGLQVDSFTLVPGRDDGSYSFKIVLTQVGNNNRYLSGLVAVNVIGHIDGEKQVIALRDLSEEIDDLGVKFKFRYFQDIEGSLSLPEKFEPLEIQVVAQAGGRKAAQAESTFDWEQLTGN